MSRLQRRVSNSIIARWQMHRLNTDIICLVSPIQNAEAHPEHHNKYDLKKRDGPYTYTEAVPFPNATFINETYPLPNATYVNNTLTITLTSTDLITETAHPTTEAIGNSTEATTSVSTPFVPTATFTNAYGGIPYGSFSTESAINSSNSVVFSSTSDALGYSTAR
jgi:hypothetical protein